ARGEIGDVAVGDRPAREAEGGAACAALGHVSIDEEGRGVEALGEGLHRRKYYTTATGCLVPGQEDLCNGMQASPPYQVRRNGAADQPPRARAASRAPLVTRPWTSGGRPARMRSVTTTVYAAFTATADVARDHAFVAAPPADGRAYH